VENIGPNPTAVRDSTARLSFPTELTQDSVVQLSPQMFSYTGRHVVKLCRAQPEYAVMAQASSSASETLTEVYAKYYQRIWYLYRNLQPQHGNYGE
jgi:hypothetical protein